MSEDQIPAWFYKFIMAIIGAVGGIGLKSWFDKNVWNKKERRKDGNYLVINEDMINRIITSFEEHTKTMQDVAHTLRGQMDVLRDHIEEDRESARLLRDIHDRVVGGNGKP